MPILEKSKDVLIELDNKCCGYLKIMGEIEPQLSNLPIITDEKKLSNWYVYEYMWELSLTCSLDEKTERPIPWVDKLSEKDDAILVQVFFHTNNTKYSIRALTGTLKPPFMIKKGFKDILCDKWLKITGTATKLIGEAIKIPGTKAICTAIDAISELEKDSIPTSHAYKWYSKMIATREDGVMLNGVEWGIKRDAFKNLGNRLMGGIGLIFIESDSNEKMDCIEVEIRARISFKKSHSQKKNENPNKKSNCDIWMPCNPNKYCCKNNRLLLKIHPNDCKSSNEE